MNGGLQQKARVQAGVFADKLPKQRLYPVALELHSLSSQLFHREADNVDIALLEVVRDRLTARINEWEG